jgi:ubiquitin-small subunit ribosomal protein S27Ae
MQVLVRLVSGQSVTVDVASGDNIAQLKKSVEDVCGIPADMQTMLTSGSIATDASLVTEDCYALTLGLLGGGKKRKKKVFTKPKKEKHKRKKISLGILKYYKVDANSKIVRLRKECTSSECPPATFMAMHQDRYYCGRCGLTLVFTDNDGKSNE